jgi:hypothetical protein
MSPNRFVMTMMRKVSPDQTRMLRYCLDICSAAVDHENLSDASLRAAAHIAA